MMRHLLILSCASFFAVNIFAQKSTQVVTSDIDHFWSAYDKIVATDDSAAKYGYINKLYIDKATPGLKDIMQVRDYTAKSYIDAIRNYPLFWQSVRKNTYRSKALGAAIKKELAKFSKVYPSAKPADIYFTIGALRTPGTVLNGRVLIGAEIALSDSATVSSELPEAVAKNRRVYFDSNPINDVVLLNVHEYVHTQQNRPVNNLLSNCLYEGVAEFVSVKSTGRPSAAPAIGFGAQNMTAVRKQFEADMFSLYKTDHWLWSDAFNKFNVRDLGYYIGYAIAEGYYQKAPEKQQAIKDLIELDYTDEKAVEKIVDTSGFLTASLDKLYESFDHKRPVVTGVQQFQNGSPDVDPAITSITVLFAQKMDTVFRSTGFGDLGKEHFPPVSSISFAGDGMSVTYHVNLVAGKEYQLMLENGYRSVDAIQLKQYLVHFTTKK